MIQSLQIIVVAAATVLTWLVCWWVLRDRKFPMAGLLASAVALLAAIGIAQGGSGVITVILLPYAALALSLLGLFILAMLAALAGFVRRRDRRSTGWGHGSKGERKSRHARD